MIHDEVLGFFREARWGAIAPRLLGDLAPYEVAPPHPRAPNRTVAAAGNGAQV